MKHAPTILVVLVLSLAGCTPLFSPPQPPSLEDRQKEFVACFRHELQPTDEQLKTLQEKIFRSDTAPKDTADSLRKATDELERGLESDMSEPMLLAHFEKVGKLKGQLAEDHFRRMLQLRSILTPEQRAKFLVCKRKMGPAALPQE